jgi:hypothetical protein
MTREGAGLCVGPKPASKAALPLRYGVYRGAIGITIATSLECPRLSKAAQRPRGLLFWSL